MTLTEKRPRIGVVGSSNVDLVTYVDRMPVWGETIAAPRFEMSHGGKGANQAVAAAKLGASVIMVSKVGDDLMTCDLILLQLEVPLETVYGAIAFGKRHGVKTVLNPAPAVRDLDNG